VTPLLAQALLFTTSANLGYRIFVIANEKFINVFVRAFRESDASGHRIAKIRLQTEDCRTTASLILRC